MTETAPVVLLNGKRHRLSAVIMDCDGVIFDSNIPKTRAFGHALASYPEAAVETFLDYHRSYGGVSRYAKFEHFFSALVDIDEPEKATLLALESYASAVQNAYRQLQPRSEALTFASQMGGKSKVFVVSGSDEKELRNVFRHHGIDAGFAEIFGSPTSKTEHVQRILPRNTTERMLLVGDGRADLEAALAVDAHFIFLAEMSEWKDADLHIRQHRDAAEKRGVVLTRAENWDELLTWVT
jgi:phosphoglycolate phosphatase-like HAD superfamily hydrolase